MPSPQQPTACILDPLGERIRHRRKFLGRPIGIILENTNPLAQLLVTVGRKRRRGNTDKTCLVESVARVTREQGDIYGLHVAGTCERCGRGCDIHKRIVPFQERH